MSSQHLEVHEITVEGRSLTEDMAWRGDPELSVQQANCTRLELRGGVSKFIRQRLEISWHYDGGRNKWTTFCKLTLTDQPDVEVGTTVRLDIDPEHLEAVLEAEAERCKAAWTEVAKVKIRRRNYNMGAIVSDRHETGAYTLSKATTFTAFLGETGYTAPTTASANR